MRKGRNQGGKGEEKPSCRVPPRALFSSKTHSGLGYRLQQAITPLTGCRVHTQTVHLHSGGGGTSLKSKKSFSEENTSVCHFLIHHFTQEGNEMCVCQITVQSKKNDAVMSLPVPRRLVCVSGSAVVRADVQTNK